MNMLTRLAVALALPAIFAASFSAPPPLPTGQAGGTLVAPLSAGGGGSRGAEGPQALQGDLRAGSGPALPRAEQQGTGG